MSDSSIALFASAAASLLKTCSLKKRKLHGTFLIVYLFSFINPAVVQAQENTAQATSQNTPQHTNTGEITLVWNGISQAHGYQLEELAPGQSGFAIVNVGTDTRITLSERAYGEYRYRVIGCLAIPPSTSLTCTTEYARYSDELVTQLNAPVIERRVIFLHTDALGSPAAETDVDGNVLN